MATIPDGLLVGAVDVHYHPGPSPYPRKLDIVEAAQHFESLEFAGAIFKSHQHPIIFDLLTVTPTVLSKLKAKFFGGIALNSMIGGLNPHAVELSLAMGARIVWFPTLAAKASLDYDHEHGSPFEKKYTVKVRQEIPLEVWAEDGKSLKPVVYEIFDLIKEYDAICASGHLSAPEVMTLFREAHRVGIERLVVTHPHFITALSLDEARELADLGAYMEHQILMYRSEESRYSIDHLKQWIDVVGPGHTILSSDTGQIESPTPAELYPLVLGRLLDVGVDEKNIRQMISTNPGELLDLAV